MESVQSERKNLDPQLLRTRPRKGEGAEREGRHVYRRRAPRRCVLWRPREDRT